jgi:hypothetical protein
METVTNGDEDKVMAAALGDLTRAVEANASDGHLLVRRIDRLRRARAAGRQPTGSRSAQPASGVSASRGMTAPVCACQRSVQLATSFPGSGRLMKYPWAPWQAMPRR